MRAAAVGRERRDDDVRVRGISRRVCPRVDLRLRTAEPPADLHARAERLHRFAAARDADLHGRVTDLFAPVCSIATTQRRRFFWAAWWTSPPTRIPFRKPDASDGGAATRDAALAAARARAGVDLVVVDALWARAWMRVLRGQAPWPSRASQEPRGEASSSTAPGSIWTILGVARTATLDEVKAAYKKRALETHPDQGGDAEDFAQVLRAWKEAQKRLKKPHR